MTEIQEVNDLLCNFIFLKKIFTFIDLQSFTDTKEVVDTAEELLDQLVVDRANISEDFFFGATNLGKNKLTFILLYLFKVLSYTFSPFH